MRKTAIFGLLLAVLVLGACSDSNVTGEAKGGKPPAEVAANSCDADSDCEVNNLLAANLVQADDVIVEELNVQADTLLTGRVRFASMGTGPDAEYLCIKGEKVFAQEAPCQELPEEAHLFLMTGETITVTLGGVDYETTLIFHTLNEAKFAVNGEITDSLRPGDTDYLNNGATLTVQALQPEKNTTFFVLGTYPVPVQG